MRIAHLPSSYFPETVGGTEAYVRHLCAALSDQGHETAVVWHTAAQPASDDPHWPEDLVRLPPFPPRRRRDLYRTSTNGEPPGFREFLIDWKPDLVHFHAFTLGAGLGHAQLARTMGVPYMATYHTPAMSCLRGTLMRWGNEGCDGKLEPRRCAACVLHARGWPKLLAQLAAGSPLSSSAVPDGPWLVPAALPSLLAEAQAAWCEFFSGSAHVLACAEFCANVLYANGIPPDRVTVLRQALPGTDRKRRLKLPLRRPRPSARLGFFGRFTPAKGPDLLVEATRRLRAEGVDVVAELVGPIPEAERPWAQRFLQNANGGARYLGVKQGEDLANWLTTLDLVVLPSRCPETGPLTLLEAWDRGVPVIGTDLGGIRDFVAAAGLSAFLFPINDLSGLAAAVRRVLAWDGPAPEVCIPGVEGLAQRMEEIYQRCTYLPATTPVSEEIQAP
ncbi:MAG TPA: glycosyltransferase [Gemmataceae bacterium]|nr:glycosyltransferase [Gemmataceae bacterium]